MKKEDVLITENSSIEQYVNYSYTVESTDGEENAVEGIFSFFGDHAKATAIETIEDTLIVTTRNVVVTTVNLCFSVLPFLLSVVLLRLFFKEYVVVTVDKLYDFYWSYAQEQYKKSLQAVRLFSRYKRFQRNLKWFVWRNRWKYGEEIAELCSVISESKYSEDQMYLFEVMQLLTDWKQLQKLLKEGRLQEVVKKIEKLNQEYWSIDF